MKKILILLFVLLLGGCYDYQEINELKMVSSMFIDYVDDEYVVNLEIIDTNEQAKKGSYFVKGTGKSLSEAINCVYRESVSSPYFSHMNVVVLSNALAKKGIEPLYEYLDRNIEIRKDFHMFVSDELDELMKLEMEPGDSIGAIVKKMTERTIENNGRYATSQFRTVLYDYLRNIPFVLGSIELDEDNIKLGDTYAFKDDKLVQSIDEKVALLLNLLNNQNKRFEYGNKVNFEIHDYKLEPNFEKNKLTVKCEALARILSVEDGSAKSKEDIEKMCLKLKKELEETLKNTLLYVRKLDIDIFGLNYKYYLQYPDSVKSDTWKKIDYDVEVELTIGEKGMLMEALKEAQNGK